MKIKKFHELNESIEDSDIVGIRPGGSKKIHTSPNRRQQHFYNYYTGERKQGKSKYELTREVFKLADRNDEIGTLAQMILQVERESMAHDIQIKSEIG
jgi:hypothetical protein